MLEESLRLHTFYRDLEEEDIWLTEKEYFVSSTEYGNDINTTTLLLQQHSVYIFGFNLEIIEKLYLCENFKSLFKESFHLISNSKFK